MHTPTVSVIIPAYKALGTVGRAVDSLFAQTRLPDEIIVVDDGSPDDIAPALVTYGERVRLVRKPNGGAASARNCGIDQARGDLLAFLDADDYFEPAKIERQLEVFRRHPEVGLCATRAFSEEPATGRRRPPSAGRGAIQDRVLQPAGPEVFVVAVNVWTMTAMVRRDVLGTMRFDTGLKTAEDIEMWIRLVQAAPVYLLSEPLSTQVLVPGSLSRSDVAGDCRNMLEVVRRHGRLLGWAGRRSWEARVYRTWAAGHLGSGEPRKAFGPAWRRWLRQPWSPQAWWIVAKSAAWSCTPWGSPLRPGPDYTPSRTRRKPSRAECR
jgi:glycosyltransferase involved in cell wall biosynthesis